MHLPYIRTSYFQYRLELAIEESRIIEDCEEEKEKEKEKEKDNGDDDQNSESTHPIAVENFVGLAELSENEIETLDVRRRERRAFRRAQRHSLDKTISDWISAEGINTCASVASSEHSLGDFAEIDLEGKVKRKHGFFNPPSIMTVTPIFTHCCKTQLDNRGERESDLILAEEIVTISESDDVHLLGIGSWKSAESTLSYTRLMSTEVHSDIFIPCVHSCTAIRQLVCRCCLQDNLTQSSLPSHTPPRPPP